MPGRPSRLLASPWSSLGVAFVLAACLQEGGGVPDGRLLIPGRDLRELELGWVNGSSVIFYDRRGDDGKSALWMLPFADGLPPRLVGRDRAADWPVTVGATGEIYYMRTPASLPVAGGESRRVATLSRRDLVGRIVDETAAILRYTVWRDLFLVEVASPGSSHASLGVGRAGQRGVANVGAASSVSVGGAGRVYFVQPLTYELGRVAGPQTTADVLRTNVLDYWILDPKERRAAVQVRTAAGAEHLLLGLGDGAAAALPVPGTCAWTASPPGGAELACFDPPSSAAPGWRLFLVDVEGREARAYEPPLGPGAAPALVWRPDAGTALLADAGGMALFDPAGQPPFRAVDARGSSAEWAPDGRHLVYVEAATRRLTVRDPEFAGPPRPVSPAGAVPESLWFTRAADGLAFTARFGDRRADLYAVDLESGASRTLASAIGRIAVGLRRLLVIADVNEQDRAGDLLLIDLDERSRRLLARAVTDFVVVPPQPHAAAVEPGARVAFVVRGRTGSRVDGLWTLDL